MFHAVPDFKTSTLFHKLMTIFAPLTHFLILSMPNCIDIRPDFATNMG